MWSFVQQIQAGENGPEMIPNKEFWSKLPGFVKDGLVFTKYSRLSLIRFSRGKIIHSNYREIRIIESRSNSNYRLKLAKNRITEGN